MTQRERWLCFLGENKGLVCGVQCRAVLLAASNQVRADHRATPPHARSVRVRRVSGPSGPGQQAPQRGGSLFAAGNYSGFEGSFHASRGSSYR